MSQIATLELARRGDAGPIAAMSRELIEHGLPWTWTPARVLRAIDGADTSVVIARRERSIAAFGILYVGDERSHLNLLAVAPAHQRCGLGRRLIDWLSLTSLEAGVFRIDLELRLTNEGARAFYERLGFERRDAIAGYYQGRETALRMTRRLGIAAPDRGERSLY